MYRDLNFDYYRNQLKNNKLILYTILLVKYFLSCAYLFYKEFSIVAVLNAVYIVIIVISFYISEKYDMRENTITFLLLAFTGLIVNYFYSRIYPEQEPYFIFNYINSIIAFIIIFYVRGEKVLAGITIVIFIIVYYFSSLDYPQLNSGSEVQYGNVFLYGQLILGGIYNLCIVWVALKIISEISRDRTPEQITLQSSISEQERNDLYRKAIEDEMEFYNVFNIYIPGFKEKLLEISPSISVTEVKTCCYFFLGFSNSEIAEITRSSPKAIESRHFRIRKKLNVPSGISLFEYLQSI